MIRVNPRARRHEDRAGDPLDGLVNLFDLGIVLSVGFLLAALSSLNLAGDFSEGRTRPAKDVITVPSDAQVSPVPPDGQRAIGQGSRVGTVYRLKDGRLVYVVDPLDDRGPLAFGGGVTLDDPVTYFWDGLHQAWDMIVSRDPFLMHLIKVTLQVAGVSTLAGLVVGLPLGLVLALGRFPGRTLGIVLANAGLGLPPVVVGLVLSLLMFPEAPLGRFHLLFTLRGVYIAQTCLTLPIVTALTVSAVRDISPGLLDQARAFGAGRLRVATLATREARIGILAALIAAAGSAFSEVGAVVLVGGNIDGLDQTLASAALESVGAGHFAEGLAIGIVLLGIILVVLGLLTWLQYGARTHRGWNAS